MTRLVAAVVMMMALAREQVAARNCNELRPRRRAETKPLAVDRPTVGARSLHCGAPTGREAGQRERERLSGRLAPFQLTLSWVTSNPLLIGRQLKVKLPTAASEADSNLTPGGEELDN